MKRPRIVPAFVHTRCPFSSSSQRKRRKMERKRERENAQQLITSLCWHSFSLCLSLLPSHSLPFQRSYLWWQKRGVVNRWEGQQLHFSPSPLRDLLISLYHPPCSFHVLFMFHSFLLSLQSHLHKEPAYQTKLPVLSYGIHYNLSHTKPRISLLALSTALPPPFLSPYMLWLGISKLA